MTMASKLTQQQEFWAGAQQTIPLIVGAIPFGIIFGTLAALPSMSAIVFAGSSQFIALGLLGAGTPLGIIVLTTWVVNLRHLLYAVSLVPYVKHLSQAWKLPLGFLLTDVNLRHLLYAVSLVPYVKHLSQAWKLPLGFLLTDENFMVAIQRYRQDDSSNYKHWFQLGSALAMYVNWQLCTLLGLTLGQSIPNAAAWGLDFAMVATFIGMTIPYLTNRPMVATVVVSGITALCVRALPHQLGLMVAAIAGIITGVLLENQLNKASKEKP